MADATAVAEASAAMVVVEDFSGDPDVELVTGSDKKEVESVPWWLCCCGWFCGGGGGAARTLASLPALGRPPVVPPTPDDLTKKPDPRRIFSDRLLIMLAAEDDRGRPLFVEKDSVWLGPAPALEIVDPSASRIWRVCVAEMAGNGCRPPPLPSSVSLRFCSRICSSSSRLCCSISSSCSRRCCELAVSSALRIRCANASKLACCC